MKTIFHKRGNFTKYRDNMSSSSAFFCRTLCPVGIYFCRTLSHYCRTLSDVRRLFPGLQNRVGSRSYLRMFIMIYFDAMVIDNFFAFQNFFESLDSFRHWCCCVCATLDDSSQMEGILSIKSLCIVIHVICNPLEELQKERLIRNL